MVSVIFLFFYFATLVKKQKKCPNTKPSHVKNIQETGNNDIEKFADALSDFGLLEMSIVTSQAISRLRFLDELNILIDNSKTLEKTIHKVLEKNLGFWEEIILLSFQILVWRLVLIRYLAKNMKAKMR